MPRRYVKPEICNDFLVPLPDGVYLDGELMLRGDYTFQETISAIKKYNPNTAKDLVYCVYDLYDKNRPDDNFDVRYQHLVSIVEKLNKGNIDLVFNYNADNKTEFLQEHQDFVDLGYEGTMVRLNAPYTPGHRSSSLLKHKDFVDAEYRIVDIVAGNGLYADCGMLVCVTDDGSTFNVSLADTLDAKRDVLKYPENYLGRWLKVKFQELTDSGIPRFPVGLGVRDAIEG